MGRSAPTFTHAFDEYIKKFRSIASRYLPEEDMETIETIIREARRIQNLFIALPMDPVEALLLGGILSLYREIKTVTLKECL
jgi:hypothetical protein